MNKQQRHAIDAITTNAAVITRIAAQEQKGFSRNRKHAIEACYSSVTLHAHKLGLDVPRLGTFYNPDEYLSHCEQLLQQIAAKYGTVALAPASESAGGCEEHTDDAG